jgi:hypothetical protein
MTRINRAAKKSKVCSMAANMSNPDPPDKMKK